MSYDNGKFKGYLKLSGWNGVRMSKFMGLDYSYYRKRTQNRRVSVPLWVLMFNKGWEMRDELGCDCEKKSVDSQASNNE